MKLQEKGNDFWAPFTVLVVCNPQEVNKVLSKELLIGYLPPCKLVVYEEGNTTKIGMPKTTSLFVMVEKRKS